MRNANDLMVQYAAYHRDRRNIATHCVGVPLIVFAVGVLMSRGGVVLGGNTVSYAWLLWLAATLWYLTRGNLVLALAVSAMNGVLFALAQPFAAGSAMAWLGTGVGAFAVGWVIQFIGHYYEGRKPAFLDDLVGLLVGPMFIAGELLFALGGERSLAARIEAEVGPTIRRAF